MTNNDNLNQPGCERHPDRPSVRKCAYCGRALCAACAAFDPRVCPSCVRESGITGPPQPERPPRPAPGTPRESFLARPRVTYVLLAAIVISYLGLELAGGSTNDAVLIRYGATVGPLLFEGQFWRFLSSMFIHIGLAHLGFNAFALFTLGPEMERIYGPLRYLLLYLATGLFGSVASFVFRGPMEFSAGASGAIFGIIGLNLAFLVVYRDRLGDGGRRQRQSILRLIALNLLIGFSVPGINNVAHIGGLVSGIILGYGMAPHFRRPAEAGAKVIDDNPLRRSGWQLLVAALVLAAMIILTFFRFNFPLPFGA